MILVFQWRVQIVQCDQDHATIEFLDILLHVPVYLGSELWCQIYMNTVELCNRDLFDER